jgi:hypothetical protein
VGGVFHLSLRTVSSLPLSLREFDTKYDICGRMNNEPFSVLQVM